PRATHPSWRVAQRQRHACEVKMAPEAWLAAVVHLAHTAEAATTARDARCRLDVADQARLGELHRLDDSELDSEHGVEQGCSAHGRRGSEGCVGIPLGTPSALRVPQPFLLAHLVPTDPRPIPPPCDEITPARLPPNLSESQISKTGARRTTPPRAWRFRSQPGVSSSTALPSRGTKATRTVSSSHPRH